MMLVLRVLALNGQPLSQTIVGRFDQQGGTIGRSDVNTMTLPDPERHISRRQAIVTAEHGRFEVRNAASANAIFVNGRSLGSGESNPLKDHDELRIGGYVLGVRIEPSEAGHPAGGDRAVDAHAVIAGSAADHRTDPPRAANRRPQSDAPARLPDDFDPFADPAGPSSRPAASPPPAIAGQDLLGMVGATPARSASIDTLFDLASGPGGDDALAGFLTDRPAGQRHDDNRPATVDVDPLAMFRIPSRAPAPHSAAVGSDHVPDWQAAYQPPSVVPPAAPPPAMAPAEPTAQEAGESPPSAEALWQAFCEGADIRAESARNLDVERMRRLGRMMRAAVEGTIRLMAARATSKSELRASVTTIRTTDNNPLKFAPDGQRALEQVLQPPLRGFMDGPAAMKDAMDDLLAHAIGTMAGMRAALGGMLGRFEPGPLERMLVGRAVIDSMLPMARKARLWDLYLHHFDAIREEAREDFDRLFGDAFVEAYEAQVDALRPPRASRT